MRDGRVIRALRARPGLSTLLATGGALLALLPHPAFPQPARDLAPFEEQVLFRADLDPGYACYRIPAVVTTTRGTLLAFAEGRKENCGDATDIDLVLKRSTDGGRTWGPLQVVDPGDGDTHGNPAPVVDRRTGRIVLATTYNKGREDAGNCDVPCDRTPHLQHSDDDGLSWSRPRDLSAQIRPRGWNSWYATGPGHGIQLAGGPRRGRLVIGVNAESHDGGHTSANHAALVLSDDGGEHWRLGALDSYPVGSDDTYRQKPSELTLAERGDGAVYVNGREQNGTELGNRDEAVSRDGGASFTAPFRALPGLYSPMVQGAVAPLRPGRWLLSLPADPDRRRTMTIRSSYDQGRTWESAELGRRVTADWSGYSDMAVIAPGTTGLLYEAGKADARQEIRFARFTEEWLGLRRDPGPTTPDRAPGGRDGQLLGAPRLVGGRFGGALSFDGKDSAVRVPYRPSLPLGTRDFTAVLWFRYRAGRGEQPFLWMGGMGGAPQVALRGEPGERRIAGQVTAVTGAGPARTVTVRSAGAYDDGKWHQLALRRTGDQVTLTVDGVSTVAPGVPGTVARNSTFGVHVGQKPDGRASLTGDLDEVRVYGRALTDGELRALRGANALPGAPERRGVSGEAPGAGTAGREPVLWLPLDRIRRVGGPDRSGG
ncbi:laminin G [Streptomyces cinnamoneus]|uniref:exo-alpha-sialidase n=1 Tax=Streptomyces cinnamoneus TaxID=53446 RepID=A0A2G1XAK0_STRCJ|nr:sialidase family protein [Streptomyces cinnamoneus]PHQ48199.1 laminin G [Streptomyces cinnamoneus]PPT15825.1 laminin G [Streptomyces cinnamoneus]